MENRDQENRDQWCFAWFPEAPDSVGKNRAALQKAFKWRSGDVITVSFLDGDAGVQNKIKKAASTWTQPGMANVRLDFRSDPNTLIRISFKNKGSWSTVGTSCKQITDKTKPTMNYGWLTPTSSDADVQRVVLHEFGHALGLIHEHQNPTGGIKWNRDAVIRDLSGPPNNFTPEQIELNMFQAYSKDELNATKVDPKSIMMYPIPKSWTLDGFSVGLNSTLSDTDRGFIKQQYP